VSLSKIIKYQNSTDLLIRPLSPRKCWISISRSFISESCCFVWRYICF